MTISEKRGSQWDIRCFTWKRNSTGNISRMLPANCLRRAPTAAAVFLPPSPQPPSPHGSTKHRERGRRASRSMMEERRQATEKDVLRATPSFDTIRPKSTAFRQISTENEHQSCFKAEKGYTSAKVPFVPSAC
ncbi:hypothetical protein HZH68_013785 [Vespula germanica]|uniref:Uncharacterized protein n=1 Tax=Vespula germanica TaxID=30212 RepID=A0A834MUV9_VESGE|nr:hypothetical protein HZH68_013785 [Vespula germanica]